MIVIADSRMPNAAKKNLENLAKPLWLEPQEKVYESIAAHPDIFFCQTKNRLIVSPNLPSTTVQFLEKLGISYQLGTERPESTYPQTAIYNAVATNNWLIHKLTATDEVILSQYAPEQRIDVAQGYTRCNLLALDESHFVTSDRGIEKALKAGNLAVLFIDPQQIQLPGQPYGFSGGCCGIIGNKIVICGDYQKLKESEALFSFTSKLGFELLSLYDGPLIDVGGLLFVDEL